MVLGAILGAGARIFGAASQARAKRKQQKRLEAMLNQIMAEQRQDFRNASAALAQGRRGYETDPNRARMMGEANTMLTRGGPFDAGTVSLMKANAREQVGASAAAGMSNLRETLQRRGLGNSGVGIQAELMQQGQARTEAGRQSNAIELQTRQAQEDYQRRALEQYSQIIGGDLQARYGQQADIAHLYGSKQYGNSGLFAALGS